MTVGLRKDGASWKKAVSAGHQVAEIADAVKNADVVMFCCRMSSNRTSTTCI